MDPTAASTEAISEEGSRAPAPPGSGSSNVHWMASRMFDGGLLTRALRPSTVLPSLWLFHSARISRLALVDILAINDLGRDDSMSEGGRGNGNKLERETETKWHSPHVRGNQLHGFKGRSDPTFGCGDIKYLPIDRTGGKPLHDLVAL